MSTPIDMLGIPKAPKSGPASTVRVSNSTANGTVGVRVKCFSLVWQNMGNAVIYKSDSANGDSFTAVLPGIYAVTYSATSSASDAFAISRNAVVTTQADSLPNGVALAVQYTTAADTPVSLSWTGYLESGDIIRAHQGGSAPGSVTGANNFTMTMVSPA